MEEIITNDVYLSIKYKLLVCGMGSSIGLPYLLKVIQMTNHYQQVGKRIRLIRKREELTQAELAEKVGLSNNYVGLIERGKGHPTLETLGQVADALGVKLSDFFFSDEDENKTSKQALAEIEHLLKSREPQDAHFLVSLGKKIFERFPAKK